MKTLGLRGVKRGQKLISFGPFVYCLWTILLCFFSVLDFFSLLFLFLLRILGGIPLTENFRGDTCSSMVA